MGRALSKPSWSAFAALLLAVGLVAPAAAQEDRHVGYYYPEPGSQETYTARAAVLPEASRELRIAFITGLTNQMLARPFAPTEAIFAKGDQAEKMIVVAMDDGRLDTIYRARALFANMTAVARVMPIFKDYGVETWFTFFDLAKLLGFEQITVTDGRVFAHQILIR
ncbi:MAG: molybdopterin-guanine dinucleotide biosynthesis protein A [Kiloniellales bacterium]